MPINLDEARAARRESEKEAPTVVFGGETFTLPVELPFEVVEAFADITPDGQLAPRAVVRVIQALLGDRYHAFLSHAPSMADMEALIEGIAPEYGFGGLGESEASAES